MNLWQYPIYWVGKRSRWVRNTYHRLSSGKYLWGVTGLIRDYWEAP